MSDAMPSAADRGNASTFDGDLAEVRARHGLAERATAAVHNVPAEVSEDLVAAIGKLSAALETAEAARGHLYEFHRMSGTTDREIREAVSQLREAGRDDIADAVEQIMVGRDVVDDMWTFQIVEKYDAQYWTALRDTALAARHAAGLRDPHVFESSMKYREESSD